MGTDDDGKVADELTSVDLANIWEDNFMYKKINSDLRIVYVTINKYFLIIGKEGSNTAFFMCVEVTLSNYLKLSLMSSKLLNVTCGHPMSQYGHPKSSQKKADDVNNYLCYLWPLKIKKWPSKQTKKIDARIVGQTRPSKQIPKIQSKEGIGHKNTTTLNIDSTIQFNSIQRHATNSSTMSTTTEKSPTKIDPLRNGDSFSNNDERIDFCHSVLRSIPIFLENPADESLEGDVKGCLLKLTTGDFSTTMNKDNEDALRILKGDEITLGTQRMALEDQMADWIDALEVKETDVANLHDRKTELEEDIEDVKNRVKSKYSEERARMERKMQDLTERCELEIQTNTESERATLNVTKLLLNEKQDDVHAFNETLTHREKTIKELDLKGKRLYPLYFLTILRVPFLTSVFIFFSGELKHEEVEAKARDYAKLDVVNCGVGNNTLCITHEQFRTLIQEGLSNLQPDSVPEWIRSQHLGR